MAFLSRGHQPGAGPYGQQLNRAIDFVLSCQKEDGLLCLNVPGPVFQFTEASQTGSYNHAIAGLMLGEVYGDVTGQRARKVRSAIGKAIAYTRALQTRKKPYAADEGGVRYIRTRDVESDSDLSVTAWQLMFLRSARNAEFNVPQKYMDDGIAYVRRCWNPGQHMFNYIAIGGNGGPAASRSMTGAGILSLSMAGEHNTLMAKSAGDWLVAHPYGTVNVTWWGLTTGFTTALLLLRAGGGCRVGPGRYWEKIYPPLINALLNAQTADGSFPIEPKQDDAPFGAITTTAMAVLGLTPAYQLLPVYQEVSG